MKIPQPGKTAPATSQPDTPSSTKTADDVGKTASTSPAKAPLDEPSVEAKDRVLADRANAFASSASAGVNSGGQSPLSVRASQLSKDESKALDDAVATTDTAVGNVGTVFMYTSAPGSAGPTAPGAGGLEGDIDGRNISAAYGMAGDAVERRVFTELDRFGLTFAGSSLRPGSELGGGFFVMEDWASAWVDHSRELNDGRARSLSFGPFADPTGGGLSGSAAFRSVNGVTRKIGGFGGGNLERSIVDLGPYSGDVASLAGSRCVELQRDVSGFATGTPGIRLPQLLGIGGRLGVAKGKAVHYRTHVSPERAKDLLFEEGGRVRSRVRDGARAIGLKEEPLEPPDLSQLDRIHVGDRISIRTEGMLSGGLVLGPGFGAWVGAQGAMRGEFEIGVQRPAEHLLQVSVVPTKVQTLQVSGRALVLDGMLGQTKARAMAQSFTFDVREPEAVAAYQALLKGELPGGGKVKAVPKQHLDGVPLAQTVMPTGVQRGPVERVSGRSMHAHTDIGFTVLTLGATRQTATYERSLDTAETRLRETLRTEERSRAIPLSGDEARGVRASVLRAVDLTDVDRREQFIGLKLVGYASDSKTRGLSFNDEINAINRAFGTRVEHFNERALKQARSVDLELWLEAEDLQALADLDDGLWRGAGRAAGLRLRPLLALAQRLRTLSDPEQRARAVQEYVGDNGFKGLGLISRLVGPARVAISTSVGAADTYLPQARELLFKYEQPIATSDNNAQLATRFEEVEELDDKLLRLRALILDDPVLRDEDKTPLVAQVDAARPALREVLHVDHLSALDRRGMVARLGSGYCTKWEQRAIAALSD